MEARCSTFRVPSLTFVLCQFNAPAAKETGPLLAREADGTEQPRSDLLGRGLDAEATSPVTTPWSTLRRESAPSSTPRRRTTTRERTSDEEVFGLERESILNKRKALGLRGIARPNSWCAPWCAAR